MRRGSVLTRIGAGIRARIARQEERNAEIWEGLVQKEQAPDEGGREGPEAAEALIELGLEAWSLTASVEGWIGRLDGHRERRARSRLQWTRGRVVELLEGEGVTLQDLTGREWDEGDAVEVLNPAEPEEGQRAVVSTMVEPIVLRSGRVARRGKVTITLEGGDAK